MVSFSLGLTIYLARNSSSFEIFTDKERYSIELCPKILYCGGTVVELFRETGIGRHLDFKLVQGNFVVYRVDNSLSEDRTENSFSLFSVPTCKEDVFASTDISLVDKRRLMKFFTSIQDMEPYEIGTLACLNNRNNFP
jgi:RAB protein geranylgeranyltransferase component A